MDEKGSHLSATEQGAVLRAFSKALDREAHVLTRHPDLLWQQLYNRLQWEGETVNHALIPEASARIHQGTSPWFKSKTRYRDSQALLRTLSGHKGEVKDCAISTNGRWIVSAGSDDEIKVWDAVDGKEHLSLKHIEVKQCAISPDGQFIASLSFFDIKLWDMIAGTELLTLDFHDHQIDQLVHIISISPDNTWMAFEVDKTILIWEINGRLLNRLEGHLARVTDFSISPDGGWIVSASEDNTARLWRVNSGSALNSFAGHADKVWACSFSPDGRRVATASQDKTVRIWETSSGNLVQTLAGHAGAVFTCLFSPDGIYLASGCNEKIVIWNTCTGQAESEIVGYFYGCVFLPDNRLGTISELAIQVWKIPSGELFSALEGHTRAISKIAVNTQGNRLISASMDTTVKIWDTYSRSRGNSSDGHSSRINDLAISPVGKYIASASQDRTLKLWDFSTGLSTITLEGHTGEIGRCVISPDGTWFASASQDKTVRIWDAAAGKLMHVLEGHTGRVTGLAINHKGCLIASASDDKTIMVWEAGSGRLLHTLKGHIDKVLDCTFSSDGGSIFSAGQDSRLRVWDTATGVEVARLMEGSPIVSCTISPDGGWIVTANNGSGVSIWDTKTIKQYDVNRGPRPARLEGHKGKISSLAISPDGRWIVSASRDGTIRIWDSYEKAEPVFMDREVLYKKGTRVHSTNPPLNSTAIITGHANEVLSCAVSPDGNWIVSVGMDGMLLLFRLEDNKQRIRCHLPGYCNLVKFHPYLPFITCSDQGGNLYIFNLVGITFKPLIVSALNTGGVNKITCPACQTRHPITESQLGNELPCPTPGCGLQLKINPFVVQMT